MTRQVIRAKEDITRAGAGTVSGTQDGYLERLLKLIPTETVAAYLFLDGVIRSSLKGDPSLNAWLWAIFALIAVGNILYWRKTGVTHFVQYILLTIAFVVWIFTIGGPFAQEPWYKPFMGSVILGLFTFFVPSIYKGVPETT
jgi:hypothetical protein